MRVRVERSCGHAFCHLRSGNKNNTGRRPLERTEPKRTRKISREFLYVIRRSWRLLIRWSSLDFCKVWYLSIVKPRTTSRSDYCLQRTSRSATYILHTGEFTTALLHAENVKHLSWYSCVLPGDGPIRTKTCSSRCVVILIKLSAFVGVIYRLIYDMRTNFM